jgi:predicted unusual protein kinase regulating ubiquinone biosynthesis (AarF/ABC1/UbiB family)
MSQELSSEEAREAVLCLCHHDAAVVLRQLFEDNGGIYIKLGQVRECLPTILLP